MDAGDNAAFVPLHIAIDCEYSPRHIAVVGYHDSDEIPFTDKEVINLLHEYSDGKLRLRALLAREKRVSLVSATFVGYANLASDVVISMILWVSATQTQLNLTSRQTLLAIGTSCSVALPGFLRATACHNKVRTLGSIIGLEPWFAAKSLIGMRDVRLLEQYSRRSSTGLGKAYEARSGTGRLWSYRLLELMFRSTPQLCMQLAMVLQMTDADVSAVGLSPSMFLAILVVSICLEFSCSSLFFASFTSSVWAADQWQERIRKGMYKYYQALLFGFLDMLANVLAYGLSAHVLPLMHWAGMLLIFAIVNLAIIKCIGSRTKRTCFSWFVLAVVPMCTNFPFGKDFFPSKRQCWDYSAATTLMSTFRVLALSGIVYVTPKTDEMGFLQPYPYEMHVLAMCGLSTVVKIWLFRRFWKWDHKQRRRWRKVTKVEESERERRENHMMGKEDLLWQRRIAAFAHAHAKQAARAANGFANWAFDQLQFNFGPKHVQKKYFGIKIHDKDEDDDQPTGTAASTSPSKPGDKWKKAERKALAALAMKGDREAFMEQASSMSALPTDKPHLMMHKMLREDKPQPYKSRMSMNISPGSKVVV